jgi:hypothetical protein
MELTAKVKPDAIVITLATWITGHLVLETNCLDYDAYKALPQVVEYRGIECGKTGWNSDTGYACYQSSAYLAHLVRKS